MSDYIHPSNLANTARTTPALEDNPLTEFQLCPQVIDADGNWEVRQIVGKEDVDGVPHYLVDWRPTLLPKYSLGHAKELVDKFEARLRAQCRVKKGPRSKQDGKGQAKTDVLGLQEQKRPRGRPRKQV